MSIKHVVEIELHPSTFDELVSLLENGSGPVVVAIRENGGDVKELIETLLVSWADGWRRPGSWERGMLEQAGHAS